MLTNFLPNEHFHRCRRSIQRTNVDSFIIIHFIQRPLCISLKMCISAIVQSKPKVIGIGQKKAHIGRPLALSIDTGFSVTNGLKQVNKSSDIFIHYSTRTLRPDCRSSVVHSGGFTGLKTDRHPVWKTQWLHRLCSGHLGKSGE